MIEREAFNNILESFGRTLMFGFAKCKKNNEFYSNKEIELHYSRQRNKETFTWYLVKIGNSTVKSCQSNQTGTFYKIRNYNEKVMRYYSKVEIVRPLTKWDW